MPFMNKRLSKAIMLRSKNLEIFSSKIEQENKRNYSKQKNLCVALLRKSKRKYFGNLDEKKVCDNKKFWGAVKPLLSNHFLLVKKSLLLKITISNMMKKLKQF